MLVLIFKELLLYPDIFLCPHFIVKIIPIEWQQLQLLTAIQ